MSSHRGTMDSPTQEGSIRKRVCKACDRCRLKKSKCDGANPCSRCKTDNAICVFGERKKAHDKVYPKGYVEMLEQQQHQLVAGLRELYRRLQAGEGWPGEPLKEAHGGHPLTHDILERLDLLHVPNDGAYQYEGPFEEDPSVLQQRLINNGAKPVPRRGSVSSQSDHGLTSSSSSQGSPQSTTKDSFPPVSGAPPTPPSQSPYPRQSSLNLPAKVPPAFGMPSYPQTGRTAPDPMQLLQSSWAADTPIFDDLSGVGYPSQFDSPISYDAPLFDPFQSQGTINPMAMDWTDSSELDFSNFVTIST